MNPLQPVAPVTLEESGLSLDLMTQLVLKTLYFTGELSGSDLAKRLGVYFGVIEPALTFLKTERRCEIAGGSLAGGPSFRYRITSEGRSVAALFLQQSQYIGTAPVPVVQYREYWDNRRRVELAGVSLDEVNKGFSHLVVSQAVLDEIGPALNGGQSIFIYGPPGNGKTVMAKTLRDLLPGNVEIPRALEVEGNIIRVFDSVSHEEWPPLPEESLFKPVQKKDERWATCRRPMVEVGGELTLASLDLTFDSRSGYYHAPVQLIANGGMLLVDDFGRQRCAPQDLLNRWMVPLESGVDHLTLQSGVTFEVPFTVFIAFATNIKPSELVDEAFLRRVRYKVFAKGPSIEDFIRISENYCHDRGVPFDRSLIEQLLNGYFQKHGVVRRACHPRDLINQALLLATYRNEPRKLTLELLESACSAYFVEESW
jgi:hypothetical protein